MWILKLFNIFVSARKIPIFMTGDRNTPANYRDLSLINSTLKLITTIIKDKIEDRVDMIQVNSIETHLWPNKIYW